MTNNDELALKLKAASEKATPGNWYVDNDFDVCSENYGFVGELHGDNLVMNADFIATASPANILSLLAERDADKKRIEMLEKYVNDRDAQNQDLLMNIGSLQQRIAELETVCAESYQVVGALADAAGVFEASDEVSKALDNLSAAKLVHKDVLPFAVEARTVSVKLLDNCEHDVIAPVCSFMYQSGFEIDTSDYNKLAARVRDAVQIVMRRTLRAAGINLEVGERS